MHSPKSVSLCTTTPEECIIAHSIQQDGGSLGLREGYLSLSGRSRPKPCPLCSLLRHLPVSCPQSCAPRPAPGTHGHHWFAVRAPGYADRCPPGGLGGCLHHCQPLGRGATQGYIAYMWGVRGRGSAQHPTPRQECKQ